MYSKTLFSLYLKDLEGYIYANSDRGFSRLFENIKKDLYLNQFFLLYAEDTILLLKIQKILNTYSIFFLAIVKTEILRLIVKETCKQKVVIFGKGKKNSCFYF